MVRKLIALFLVLALVAAACGDSDSDDPVASPDAEAPADTDSGNATSDSSAGEEPADADDAASEEMADGDGLEPAVNQRRDGVSVCGLGTGEQATGEPIKLGAIVTSTPGVDFTWIPGMAGAYFDCVNENGGIHGRPIEYIVETEQIDPGQVASLAVKLIEEDGVVGLVGGTSILDCSVNAGYYADKGFFAIVAGVDHACFNSPNISAVNMGPYYSTLGGAQAAIRAGATGKLVVWTPTIPGVEVINSGALDFAEANGLEGITVLEDAPIADPATMAIRLVEAAGEGGAVILDAPGPVVLPLLLAIEQQGLIDDVIWASSTPPNDPSIAAALSPAWNDKFLINAELLPLDDDTPDAVLVRELRETYRDDISLSSFAQMGVLSARIATQALLDMDGDYTVENVNEAFRSVTNFETDILCAPWYFASGVGGNVSNNVDLTVVPRDGIMVQVEDCFEIAELDSDANILAEVRAAEAAGGLNSGG